MMMLYNADGIEQGLIRHLVGKGWNRLPDLPAPGSLEVVVGTRPTFFKTDGELYQSDISAEVIVERRLFFGEVPLKEVEGFHDEHTGALVTRQITTEHVFYEEIERSWRRLQSEDEVVVKPLFGIRAQARLPEQ